MKCRNDTLLVVWRRISTDPKGAVGTRSYVDDNSIDIDVEFVRYRDCELLLSLAPTSEPPRHGFGVHPEHVACIDRRAEWTTAELDRRMDTVATLATNVLNPVDTVVGSRQHPGATAEVHDASGRFHRRLKGRLSEIAAVV